MLRQRILMWNITLWDMVEGKKVLLGKVDTLKNVVDSLTKSISTEKFSWCRESMGIDALNLWLYEYRSHCYAKETTSGRILGICYILFMCIWWRGAHVSAATRWSQMHLQQKWPLGHFRCKHSEKFFFGYL